MTGTSRAPRRTGVLYAIAMIGALAGAYIASQTLAPLAAQWIVSATAFDSPDQVSNAEDAAFLGMTALGVFVGWSIGWALARVVAK